MPEEIKLEDDPESVSADSDHSYSEGDSCGELEVGVEGEVDETKQIKVNEEEAKQQCQNKEEEKHCGKLGATRSILSTKTVFVKQRLFIEIE